jgi:hypothetical protein
MELVQDRVQWSDLALAVLNLRVYERANDEYLNK